MCKRHGNSMKRECNDALARLALLSRACLISTVQTLDTVNWVDVRSTN